MNKNVKIFFFVQKQHRFLGWLQITWESESAAHGNKHFPSVHDCLGSVVFFFFLFFYKGSLEKISSHKLFKRDYRLSTIQ